MTNSNFKIGQTKILYFLQFDTKLLKNDDILSYFKLQKSSPCENSGSEHQNVNFDFETIAFIYFYYNIINFILNERVKNFNFERDEVGIQWCALIRDALIREKSIFSEKITGH